MITIAGMGTGAEETLTLGALKLAKLQKTVAVQTLNVPAAEYISRERPDTLSLDPLYEQAEDFDELIRLALDFFADKQDAVFFTLGSPVENEIARALNERYECCAIPGVSLSELAFAAAGVFASQTRTFAAADIEGAELSAALPTAVTEVDSPYRAADIALAFGRCYPPNARVWLVRGGKATPVALSDIPREQDFSYDTSLVFPGLPLTEREGYTFSELVELIALLRGEGGCPWDREQTHESLRQFLLEESYEAIDAINSGDPMRLCDELGDVLLQVVLHSQIASEHSDFDALDVTTSECKKMIHRHSHIFGTDDIKDAEGVLKNWDKIKMKDAGETLSQSMRSVAAVSPLMRASKVQKKAKLAGFALADGESLLNAAQALCKAAESGEGCEQVAGELLFDAVGYLRGLDVSPDLALTSATDRYISSCEQKQDEHR